MTEISEVRLGSGADGDVSGGGGGAELFAGGGAAASDAAGGESGYFEAGE